MVVKRSKGTSTGSSDALGRLRGFRFTEKVNNNRKVIIITAILTIISIIIGIFIPYALIGAGISLIVMVVTTFCLPPSRERIMEKTEV